MNSAATASLRGSGLASLLSNRSQLRLDDLFARGLSNFNDAFVVLFSGLRHPQDVLSRRNISQHNTARTSDTAFPFVVDVNLGPDRCHYHKA